MVAPLKPGDGDCCVYACFPCYFGPIAKQWQEKVVKVEGEECVNKGKK